MSSSRPDTDLTPDLSLGLSISTSPQAKPSTSTSTTTTSRHDFYTREQPSHWPPIKPLLKNALACQGNNPRHQPTFFVKVYMEGTPIGRKLDLFAHHSYDHLIITLRHMFRTVIICPDINILPSDKLNVLTYQDEQGDWMMVGDVPWEVFLTAVKRLKITRAEKC